jgi:hypothetical protein
MTTKKLTGILSLFLCIICLVSCNDNDDNFSPITLEYEDPQIKFDNESRSYTLTPFSKETTPLFIKGGDGTYKVTNENEKVVQVNYHNGSLTLKAKEIGRASIKIEDSSNNMYILSVVVKYRTLTHKAFTAKVIVKGDELTSEEHTELMNKVGNSYPINKYVFSFMNAEDSKGTVDLYYSDNNMKTGNFEKEHIVLDEENAIPIKGEYKLSEYYRITIKEDNGKVIDTFYITKNFLPLLNTRMNAHPLIQYCFVRDLTAQYKQDYLALENAYLIQIAE